MIDYCQDMLKRQRGTGPELLSEEVYIPMYGTERVGFVAIIQATPVWLSFG